MEEQVCMQVKQPTANVPQSFLEKANKSVQSSALILAE